MNEKDFLKKKMRPNEYICICIFILRFLNDIFPFFKKLNKKITHYIFKSIFQLAIKTLSAFLYNVVKTTWYISLECNAMHKRTITRKM